MRRSVLCSALVMVVAGAASPGLGAGVAAQARSDQSRLSLGMSLGYNGGTDLWQVRDQRIFGQFGIDSADVGRTIRATIGIAFTGVYYPNNRLGFAGEVHLIGLAYEDQCHLTTNSGSGDTHSICTSINGRQSPGTAVAATVGGIFRPFPWSGMQPYVRGNVGVVLSEQSAVRMTATYVPVGDSVFHDYPLYIDTHPASISPTGALALGATGFLGRSYQIRVEAKDNFVIVKEVTGTTQYVARQPAWKQQVHQVFTLSVGMEVVLEKRRGRRY